MCVRDLGHGNFASVAVPTAIPFHNPSGIRSIACGSEHSLVITNDGELSSCGWGEHGNLGGCCFLVSYFTRLYSISDHVNIHTGCDVCR